MITSTKRLSRTLLPLVFGLWAVLPAASAEVLSMVFPEGGPYVDFGPCAMQATGKYSLEGVGQVTVRARWTSPVKMFTRQRAGQYTSALWFACSAGCKADQGYEPVSIGSRIRSIEEPRNVVEQPDGWARVYDRTDARRGDFSVWIGSVCNGSYGSVFRVGERFEVSVEVTPGMTLTVVPNENQGGNGSTPRNEKGDATQPQTPPKKTGDTDTPTPKPTPTPTPTPVGPTPPDSTGPSSQPKQTAKSCPDTTSRLQLQVCRHTAAKGATIRVPIHLLGSDDLANLNLDLKYDAAVAKPVGKAEKGPLLGSRHLLESNLGQPGLARIGFAGSTGVSGSGVLAYVPFTIVGAPGTHTTITLQDTAANTSSNARPSFSLVSGELTVEREQTPPDGGSTNPKPKTDPQPKPDTTSKPPEPVRVFTALDALKALQMSVGLVPPDITHDLDKNGQITSNDARLILRDIVGR